MKERGKKAVAPIIATILLVLIVLVLASIIVIWYVAFIPEAVTKFGGNIESSCRDVAFTAELSGSSLSVVNTGDVPIYKFEVRVESTERREAEPVDEILNVGSSKVLENIGIFATSKSGETVFLVPILLGETEDEGQIQEFYCPEATGSWWETEVI